MSIILSEELARIGAGLAGPGTHSNIIVPYIETYGTEEQKQKYLPGCVSEDIITAIAMTEPDTGSDLANIQTTAIRDGDYYIINGQKHSLQMEFIPTSLSLHVKPILKTNPPHRGVSLILVEAGTPGFSKGKKLNKVGMHAQDTAELIFEDVKVPVSNRLGEEGKGFYYLMSKLQQERILAALGAQVAAEDMLDLTIQYVKERKAFGRPISKFQNTQFKIAEIATQVQLGRTFIDSLIVRHQNGENIVTEVSMAKWWITDMARKISAECMQLHGGYGYMEEYKIARRYRDIAVSPIFAGTNEIMKVIIAKIWAYKIKVCLKYK